MSRSVFALGFQQETQSGQLCTEPMSSQNRPESQGEKWVFESQFIRPRHLRSTGWTSCPPTKIRGEKDCGHIREGTMSSRVELDASPSFSMANRECVGQKKKNGVLGPAYVLCCELWWKQWSVHTPTSKLQNKSDLWEFKVPCSLSPPQFWKGWIRS